MTAPTANAAQRVDVERLRPVSVFEVQPSLPSMEPHPFGAYVRHSDYAALLLQVAAQAAEIERLHALAVEDACAAGEAIKRAEAAERAGDESFIRVAKLAERWDRIADTHGARTFTGNDHRLFANELRAAFLAANGGGRED